MRIDGHIHLFRRASAEHPRGVSTLFPAEREALAPEYFAAADAIGVDGAVVVALSHDDRYVEDVLADYSGRAAGVAVFDPPEDRAPTADEVRDLIRFHGVRLHRLGPPDSTAVGELPTFELLQAMERAGRVLWFYSGDGQQPLVAMAAERFPGLSIVLNHLGFFPKGFAEGPGGFTRADVDLTTPQQHPALAFAKYPNVSVMLSGEYSFSAQAYPYRDVSPIVQAVFAAFGADRMLWASDHPWFTAGEGYARLAELPALHLPQAGAADLAQIMGGTATRLFPVLRTGSS
jgi:predicted TIM-barrel fold metal-dependent hydrolase